MYSVSRYLAFAGDRVETRMVPDETSPLLSSSPKAAGSWNSWLWPSYLQEPSYKKNYVEGNSTEDGAPEESSRLGQPQDDTSLSQATVMAPVVVLFFGILPARL